MSEIVEDLKLSTLEITTGLGINFSATDGYISHHGEGDFVIESEISPLIIKTEAGCSGNGNIYIESSHNGCNAILMTANHGYINSFSQGQINVAGATDIPFDFEPGFLSPHNANFLQNIKSNVVKKVIAKSPYGEKILNSLNKNQSLNPNNLNPRLDNACENDLPDGVMLDIASNFIGLFSEGQETFDNEPAIVIIADNGDIIISADGVTNNADISINANGDIYLDVDEAYRNIVLTTTNTGVVVAPGKFEAGTVFQEYQPTTNPPSYGLLVPTGAVMPYAGASAPAGWLLCDGASLLRTTYSILFAIIGTTYGSVDGTHFNLPDLRSRLPLGAGAGAGLTARTLAATGGQENITNVPSHNHGLYKVTGDHPAGSAFETNVDYAIFGDYGEGTGNTFNTGATGGVNVMNPFLVLNYIIKV
jgi:microcystin-dependent protein